MMMARERARRSRVATVGFAAATDGHGIVYAKVRGTASTPESVVRIPFIAHVRPALQGREIAYAAVEAVAAELLRLGVGEIALRVADPSLAADLAERRTVPADLQLPYIALRCTLNRFAAFCVVACDDGTARDLTARARAEVSLDFAA